MRPNSLQISRLNGRSKGLPLWFGSPIQTAHNAVTFSRSLLKILRIIGGLTKRQPLVIFNVGKLESLISLAPERMLPTILIWQWRPLEDLSLLKRTVYKRLLRRSPVLVTYSRLGERYLRSLFPNKRIEWIGHFVDTEFFSPQRSASVEDYVLCPGDNARIEKVIAQVAETLKVRVIRVSNEPKVEAFHRQNSSDLIECKTQISFDELKGLYSRAAAVANIADDRYWPVGITVFCESLAMNKVTITPSGHSCSGYEFSDGSRPYMTVKDPFNTEEWINQIGLAMKATPSYRDGYSPRDLAVSLCSLAKVSDDWRRVFTGLHL